MKHPAPAVLATILRALDYLRELEPDEDLPEDTEALAIHAAEHWVRGWAAPIVL